MSFVVRAVLLVALLAALVGFGLFIGGGDAGTGSGETATPTASVWRSAVQCASCHADVWDEWLGSQHQIAYLNPEVRKLSDDFRNKECQACHLPRPVAVTGYAKRTLHRSILPNEGVSCLTCHLGSHGEILGRHDVPDAPCRPVASAQLVSVDLCESCHNQHKTTDQWRASSWAAAGSDCNDCHMTSVERSGGRPGLDHAYPASHDLTMLRRAVRFAAAVDGDELVVTVENSGAGHNFPTEERSRAADVLVRFETAHGNGDGSTNGANGREEWEQLHRFRLPYRSEPLPDTTLPAGETEVLRAPIPDGAAAATVRLWYRLTPFSEDADPRSALLFDQRIALGGATPQPGPLATPAAPPGSAFSKNTALAEALRGAVAKPPSEAPPLELPPLPPLALEPRLAHFAALAQGEAPAPPEERQAELGDLLRTAFGEIGGSTRIATMAKRALLDADDAVWALEQGLADTDAVVRANAAYELGRLGHQASIPPLLLRLKDEQDGTVVPWVAEALAVLGNHAGLPWLIGGMEVAQTAQVAGGRAIEVCREAGVELSEAPTWEELAARLRELYAHWREHGFVASAEKPPAAEPLTEARLAAHLSHLEDFQLRGVDEARFVVSRAGTFGLPLLRDAVHASETYLRTHTLEILRDLGPTARPLAPAVLPLLGDELSRVDAVRVLGRMRAAQAVPFLRPMLGAPDPELRAAAAEALGPIGDPPSLSPLTDLWKDEAQPMDVRVMAAFSVALLAPDLGARAWLLDRAEAGDYHRPTLDELLARIDERRGG